MDANSLRRRVYQTLVRFKRVAKRYLARLPAIPKAEQQTILFILGCQRSGTTLLARIFEHDWRIRVFNEFDELSSDDRKAGIRMNALPKVRDTLLKQRFSWLVAKPIVESQRCRELLEFFDNSKVVWVYRNFADVAASDLRKFGQRNGVENLRPIVNSTPNNWRAERVAEPVQKTVSDLFSEHMSPYDAAALFWYCRNMCVFSAGIDHELLKSRIMLVPYELLVTNPEGTVANMYSFLGWRFPGRRIVAEVDSDSVTKTGYMQFSPEVESLCRTLLTQLDELAGYQRPNRDTSS